MKQNDTPSNGPTTVSHSVVSIHQHRRSQYQRVHDERKRAIRGLWVRNGRYYAQLTLEDQETGRKRVRRVPLEDAATPAQARGQLEDLKVGRRKGQLPALKRTPLFSDFADQYVDYHKVVADKKRASTLETEGYAIARWKEHLGHLRLDKIKRIHIDSYIQKRKAAGRAARTVNLEVTVFRNVMNRAIDCKWINSLPTENLRPLKSKHEKRQLCAADQIEKLCSIGTQPIFHGQGMGEASKQGQPLQNAQQFSDYVKFMCYSGARLSEALRLRWSDVDWPKRQMIIGSDAQTKNGQCRAVDINGPLESHLQQMEGRRAPDSDWLFPSPRRGEEDRPAKSFRETLLLARTAAGLPKFGFHDCRHYFISTCVMSDIDYMTIAQWVGHRDGGILIGRVYGHLSNEHAQRQAEKLVFLPATFPKEADEQANRTHAG